MKAASSRARARKLLASVAAALAATLTLGTPTAQAEDHSNSYPEGYPKVGASSESMAGFWLNVKKQDGTSGHVMPNLFTVHTSASKEGAIKAYCIELDVNIKYESDLRVGDWKDFPGTNKFKDNADVQSKVAWIAQRSYPQTDLAQLIQTTSIAGLTEQEAITATQAGHLAFHQRLPVVGPEGRRPGGDGPRPAAVHVPDRAEQHRPEGNPAAHRRGPGQQQHLLHPQRERL